MLAAGLDGVERGLDCPPPVNNMNIYEMTDEELRAKGIQQLPGSLAEALDELEQSEVIKDSLGPELYEAFTRAKWAEWNAYRTQVSDWEIENYLETA
jgi:glutamine synthetase